MSFNFIYEKNNSIYIENLDEYLWCKKKKKKKKKKEKK